MPVVEAEVSRLVGDRVCLCLALWRPMWMAHAVSHAGALVTIGVEGVGVDDGASSTLATIDDGAASAQRMPMKMQPQLVYQSIPAALAVSMVVAVSALRRAPMVAVGWHRWQRCAPMDDHHCKACSSTCACKTWCASILRTS